MSNPQTTAWTLCPKRNNAPCETPNACAGGCRFNDDPVHPNRVEPKSQTTKPVDAIYEIQACLTDHGTWGVRVVIHDMQWNKEDAQECAGRLMEFWGLQDAKR